MSHPLSKVWQSRGLSAWALGPISLLYGALSGLRRWGYRLGWLRAQRLPVPVVVIGNRIVGGAGKTPTTLAIIAHLQSQGWRPGVLTRGYKAKGASAQQAILLDDTTAPRLEANITGDEPLLIWRRTRVPMAIAPRRVQGAQALLAAHPEVNILLCDDGLQHWALHRDIEVVVFDERGQGNGWLLPAGPLRESIHTRPLSPLVAPPITLYNAPAPSTPLAGHCAKRQLAPLMPLQAWWGQPDAGEHSLTPADVNQEPIWAVAGIAQPDRFFDALRAQGWRVHGVGLADHASFESLPWPQDVRHVVVTEKDAVKLQPARVREARPHTAVWVAPLTLAAPPSFWHELDQALSRLQSRPHTPR